MTVLQRFDWHEEPQQLSPAWTLHKGRKTARCMVWSHVFGWELRLTVGSELLEKGWTP
jgi:hypothetical protein